MAITTAEQSQITALTIAMFNAAPGAANIATIAASYEANGKNLVTTAKELAQLELFKEQFAELDNTAIAEVMNSHFGLVTGTEVGDAAHEYFLSQLEADISKEQILIDAATYLLTPGLADPIYDSVVTTYTNKIAVSDFYSLTQNRSAATLAELQDVISTVTEDSTSVTEAIELLKISPTATVSKIKIPDGNYTYNGEVNIEIIFADKISLIGTDATIKLMLGTTEKEAILYASTSNSLLFKYIVEDGLFSADATVKVIENSLTLNSTKIKDSINLTVDTSFAATENTLAIISDTKAPEYTLYNSHYDTDTNILSIYGEDFHTLLEADEDETTDISDKLDFTKLIWDIDSDEPVDPATVYLFDSANISSAKVLNTNEISIVITDATILETDPNYGSINGDDALDIYQGFMIDTAGNISTAASVDNLFLAVDNVFIGDEAANTLYGTSNDDIISSLQGDDTIYGNKGNDTLLGGTGDDIIVGGKGIDTMTGGAGDDTFVFENGDTKPLFSSSFGIDIITDLIIDGSSRDLIDLDVTVENINSSVSGKVNQANFISDMNSLLSVVRNGFDILVKDDISASYLTVTSGDLSGEKYLVVDYNANNLFDEDDFIVNITGSTISSLTIDSFI